MSWPNDLDQSGATNTSILEREGPTLGNLPNLLPASAAAIFTTSVAGLVPPPGSVSGRFLRDDGTWAAGGGGGGGTPGGTSGQIQYNNAGAFGGFTASGDATINTATGAVAVTKTGGVAFATSATTDTTNASNISSGALALARIAAIAANTILGSIAGGSPIALTQTQATSLINVFTSSLSGAVPGSGGGTTNFLRADGSWAPAGGGSPGGASLTVQYNNAGAFAGMSGTSWDDTNRALTMTGATITASHPQIDTVQTWNNVAVSFIGLRHNIVNTLSASGAHPFEFQIGGSPYFYCDSSDGSITINQLTGAISANSFTVKYQGTAVFTAQGFASKVIVGNANGTGIDFIASGGTLNFGGAGKITGDSSGNVAVVVGQLGYGVGVGGSVTQLTSRTTGVTLNKICGQITMFSAAGSATAASFTVTNSLVAATDTIRLNQQSGTNLYNFIVTAVAAGSFVITFFTTGGTATDAPVINYTVLKSVIT